MDALHERFLAAAQRGDAETVVALAKEHPQLVHEAVTPAANTCLHLGAAAGSLPVVVAALAHGAEPLRPNSQGDHALHFACVANKPEVVYALLAHVGHVDLGRRNKLGMGAGDLCCVADPPANTTCLALCLAFGESRTPRLLSALADLCWQTRNMPCLELLLRFGARLPDVPRAPEWGFSVVHTERERGRMRSEAHRKAVLHNLQVVPVRAWDGSAADAMRGLSRELQEALQAAVALAGTRLVEALGAALNECDWDLKTPPTPAPKKGGKAKKKKKRQQQQQQQQEHQQEPPNAVPPPVAPHGPMPVDDEAASWMHSLDARCAALDLLPRHYFSQSLSQLSAEQRAVLLDMHRAAVAELEREEELARRVFEESRVEALVDSRVTRLMLAANASTTQ